MKQVTGSLHTRAANMTTGKCPMAPFLSWHQTKSVSGNSMSSLLDPPGNPTFGAAQEVKGKTDLDSSHDHVWAPTSSQMIVGARIQAFF